MTTKAVSIRLDESTLGWLDELAKAFTWKWVANQDPTPLPGSQALAEAHLTRSDMIRICITGYLSEHDAALVRLHDEFEKGEQL